MSRPMASSSDGPRGSRTPASAEDPIESYRLGGVAVEIREGSRPGRLNVTCSNDRFRSSFEVSEYEATHYRRHMNLRITEAFRKASSEDGDGDGKTP